MTRIRRLRATLAALAAVVFVGFGVAAPAAASTDFIPLARPMVAITLAQPTVTYPQDESILVSAGWSTGGALDGVVTVVCTDPAGTVIGSLSAPADTFYSPPNGLLCGGKVAGLHTVKATFTPTGIGATAGATATYYLKYPGALATLTVGAATTDAGTPVTVAVTLPYGAAGAGGTVTARVDAGGPTASCTPIASTATRADCIALLPAGLTTGTHSVRATYSGSPSYFDATTAAAPFSVVASPKVSASRGGSSSAGKSGSNAGSAPVASPAPAPAPSASAEGATPVAERTPSASPRALAADPASDATSRGPDPIILVIATVGACVAVAALGVAVSMLIRRRRTRGV